jgi:hypothetical protein
MQEFDFLKGIDKRGQVAWSVENGQLSWYTRCVESFDILMKEQLASLYILNTDTIENMVLESTI